MQMTTNFPRKAKFGMAAVAGASLMLAIVTPASAETVRWQTIIGIESPGNVVGGISGGGQPWSTLGGRARVDLAKSQISFHVDGLVLAGGNSIGTPDGVVQVKGTIICDAGTPAPQVRDTPLVSLSPQGDAEFSGTTTLPIPSTCNASNVVFLVRVGSGLWIANGSVRGSSRED
jgi:hypothetical protein